MTNSFYHYTESVDSTLKKGQQKVLQLFHQAAQRVPAYKDFLKVNGVNPYAVKTFSDFQKIPTITKDNYLRKYETRELVWDGDLFKYDVISVSSGSTGEPYFWYRNKAQHDEAADIYYNMYKHIFHVDQYETLLVVCFSMGTWIAGSYTTLGAMAANARGLKLNVITPAIEMRDAISVIKRLALNYEQIILAGYPPYIKDLIDKGEEEGIEWKKLRIGFTLAGESITEDLRDYLVDKGTSVNDHTKVVNIYGTADAGIVAHESPLSITLRRFLDADPQLIRSHFHSSVMPTLAHFDPTKKYFEVTDNNLTFTSETGIPLIRYNIKDSGGVITNADEINELVGRLKTDTGKLLVNQWALPFLYIHGRSDFTVSLYAVLIYPENIKKALLHPNVAAYASGKFVMEVKQTNNLDQYLEITVELKPGVKNTQDLANVFKISIVDVLETYNSEYRKLKGSIGEKALPRVVLKKNGDPEYFPKGKNKHSWTRKG